VWPVLARAHNAAILFNPAAMEVVAPLAAVDLAPVIDRVRSMHRFPWVLAPEPVRPVGLLDVPGIDVPSLSRPGPGVAVGLDIGGTSMKAVAMEPVAGDEGTVLAAVSAPTWPDEERGIASLIARGRALVLEVAQERPVGSLGIGLAAPMGVGGRVLELSTILRDRVGTVEAFDGFAARVADGLVNGPVAMFNDLSNLGRHLSACGERRLVRVQIGTSFGGCWIDGDGAAVATEMGRLVVDVAPDAIPHPYLPIAGAMRTYLSNVGVATAIRREMGREVSAAESGRVLRALLEARDLGGVRVVEAMAAAMTGVVREFAVLLRGVQAVECGGSMLQGPAGRMLEERVAAEAPIPFRLAHNPGEDGAIAAALAPRVDAPLRGLRRVG
jgi:predicted NBD/HSP70 family sugar kinase